jgi:16S rRNA (cytosine1402-N4)-methyltransferase
VQKKPGDFMTQHEHHIPVLLNEVVNHLLPPIIIKDSKQPLKATPMFVDCTMGFGGHSTEVLKNWQRSLGDLKQVGYLGFDQDPFAFQYSQKRITDLFSKESLKELEFVNQNFSSLTQYFTSHSQIKIYSLLADLGVSSHQLDSAERGFSFREEGPLDMRMNPQSALTALDIINSYPEDQLIHIFRNYGEEPKAKKLAMAIVNDRAKSKFPDSTKYFSEYTSRVLSYGPSKVHPATRTFQALRISVNNELGALEELLHNLPNFIYPGARVGIISFHSLEDRIVKQFYRAWEAGLRSPKELEKWSNTPPLLRNSTDGGWGKETPRGGLTASETESQLNARSRSARLRIFEFHTRFTKGILESCQEQANTPVSFVL